jgi:putative quinone oxidoreductase, YhdH/YhfP family
MEKFRALVAEEKENGMELNIKEWTREDLPPGDVTIRVQYSSVNFKDGLATVKGGGVVRKYPMIPGIDLAGRVLASDDSRFKEGDEVLVTGYELGVSHFGGYSELARVPADWIVPLPKGLNLKDAMAVGTAGFTAALSIDRLEEHGMRPDRGPVLVTGATGGVGSCSVAMLQKLGYSVTASTRSGDPEGLLKKLGAREVIFPEELSNPKKKALLKQRWQAAIDPVAGHYLPVILASIQYGGSVALSGLTAGNRFETTVYPFILRGVSLLGIDSVFCPMEKRRVIWERISGEMRPDSLFRTMVREISLDEVPQTLQSILKGDTVGRIIVKIG